ncbi:hypothetical protein BH23GEM3_BH23GEM3_21190 [soil metagenome]|nr:ATP-binding protein [Gemmatimonadota bacterium]
MTSVYRTSGAGTSGDADAFVLELPSDLRVIEQTISYLVNRCQAFDYSGSRLTLNFRVGVTEALANAMLYGNDRDPSKLVHVAVNVDEHCVVVQVSDEGLGFDPDSVADPTRPENLERVGGRGLFLIKELMDEVDYGGRGNSVRLVLYREAPARRASGE